MVLIQHRGHSIKSEAISIVFLKPKANIGEEEAKDLVFGVVENSTVPKGVVALLSPVEVLIVRSVPKVNSL